MEVLQASFWSLDPERTVSKFAEFGRLDPGSAEARRFVELEDWANEGEPFPIRRQRSLSRICSEQDQPGSGAWSVGGRVSDRRIKVPPLQSHRRARPDCAGRNSTSRARRSASIPGHVGMIVGSARNRLHDLLGDSLERRSD